MKNRYKVLPLIDGDQDVIKVKLSLIKQNKVILQNFMPYLHGFEHKTYVRVIWKFLSFDQKQLVLRGNVSNQSFLQVFLSQINSSEKMTLVDSLIKEFLQNNFMQAALLELIIEHATKRQHKKLEVGIKKTIKIKYRTNPASWISSFLYILYTKDLKTIKNFVVNLPESDWQKEIKDNKLLKIHLIILANTKLIAFLQQKEMNFKGMGKIALELGCKNLLKLLYIDDPFLAVNFNQEPRDNPFFIAIKRNNTKLVHEIFHSMKNISRFYGPLMDSSGDPLIRQVIQKDDRSMMKTLADYDYPMDHLVALYGKEKQVYSMEQELLEHGSVDTYDFMAGQGWLAEHNRGSLLELAKHHGRRDFILYLLQKEVF